MKNHFFMGFTNSVFKGSFVRNVLTLFSGSAAAQLIGLAFLPVLTRLFTPEEFGIFYLFITTASIISLIITGGYEKSFVIPVSDNEARQLLVFALFLSTTSVIFLFFITALLSIWSDSIFNTPHSRLLIWLIPVFSFLSGMVRIFQNWSIRNKKFNQVSASNIIRNGSLSAFQTGIGLLKSGSPGLILGSCFGQIFPLGYLIYKNRNALGKITGDSVKGSLKTGKEYKDFPAYKMPSDLINEISVQSPVYVLSSLFSNAITGLYSLPHKILNQPSRFIGQAAGEVYYRQASELNSQGKDISELTFSLFKVLFLTGVIPFTAISFWGKEIFSFVFGADWEFSGRIAAWLSPWLLFVFAGSPVSYIFLIRQKLKLSFRLNLVLLVMRITALLAGALWFKTLIMTVILFSSVSLVYWIFLSFLSLRLCGLKLWRPLFFVLILIASATFPLGILKFFIL
jgi:O-antigen/teichoic acid export membrane protein